MEKEKLSLCIIVGNVENYIARFIESFKPLAHEIVIVRAIGNQEPDRTIEIAESLGAIIAPEYFNDESFADWPHVDDFAAARQQCFNHAKHELVMWADTDDVIDPESIKRICETIDLLPADFDGIEFAYHVPEDQLTVSRERIIRKGRAKWSSPIHEFLQFDQEPRLATVNGAVILHRPEGTRERNDERNLRILESIGDPTTSQKFHLFQSLRAVGRMNEAASVVCELLKSNDPTIGTAEKYELFIAAGQMADNIDIRLQMNLQALSVDPARKEAYGELCLCYIGLGRNEDALAITTAMMAQDGGSGAWNVRRKYSGYLGHQLHGMALRACGFHEQADAVETNHFIRSGKKISLIHATRGRCKQAVDARRLWFNKAKNPDAIEHIFGLDIDDPHAAMLAVHNCVVTNGKGGCVAAWNLAAIKSQGEVLVQLSDDWNPPMHWDEIILNAIGDTSESKVLAVSDGHRTDDLLCMAILTRKRYEDQGYMFYPEFFSVFSDNYFTHMAYKDGVVINARDIVFEHLHPAFGKAQMDETYARSNDSKHYKDGEKTYRLLLEGVSETGVFCSELHEGQFDSPHLAEWLKKNLTKEIPVYDFGCGNGFIVDELKSSGFWATGFEGDPIDKTHVKQDLATSFNVKPAQVVCIEVGEHVPSQYESTLINNFSNATAKGSLCVISWAVPGQPGRGHVNCLPPSEVIAKMESAGFDYESDLTKDAKASVSDLPWLPNTLLVFRKK